MIIPNVDLGVLINEQLQSIDTNKILQEKLKAQLEKTVEHTISQVFGTYSDFSKDLETYFKEQFKFDPKRLTLPQFQQFVIDQCTSAMTENFSDTKALAIKNVVRKKLGYSLTTEIEFDTLIITIKEALIEAVKDDYDNGHGRSDKKFKIVLKAAEKYSWSSSENFSLQIIEDDNTVCAELMIDENGKAWHSRGEKHDHFTKLFAAYVHQNTLIKNWELIDKTVSTEDLAD